MVGWRGVRNFVGVWRDRFFGREEVNIPPRKMDPQKKMDPAELDRFVVGLGNRSRLEGTDFSGGNCTLTEGTIGMMTMTTCCNLVEVLELRGPVSRIPVEGLDS